jgi:hypothetical protein
MGGSLGPGARGPPAVTPRLAPQPGDAPDHMQGGRRQERLEGRACPPPSPTPAAIHASAPVREAALPPARRAYRPLKAAVSCRWRAAWSASWSACRRTVSGRGASCAEGHARRGETAPQRADRRSGGCTRRVGRHRGALSGTPPVPRPPSPQAQAVRVGGARAWRSSSSQGHDIRCSPRDSPRGGSRRGIPVGTGAKHVDPSSAKPWHFPLPAVHDLPAWRRAAPAAGMGREGSPAPAMAAHARP